MMQIASNGFITSLKKKNWLHSSMFDHIKQYYENTIKWVTSVKCVRNPLQVLDTTYL